MKKEVTYLLLLAAAAAAAGIPRFRAPFVIQVSSGDPAADLVTNPFFLDDNGDGMNDAIVDWSIPRGKGRVYMYCSADWMHALPVPVSYVQSDEAPAYTVRDPGRNLTVGLISNPFVVDWDGDGLNDLIVGQLLGSKIRFYPNTGTNREPAYTSFSYLQADGVDITATYS